MERGLLEDPGDIYSLTEQALEGLPSFQEKSISNLLGAIEGSKDRPVWRLLVGLNVRHVGSHVAQVLARAFGSVDVLAAAEVDTIDVVEEIGPEIAASVHDWFRDEDNLRTLGKLRAADLRFADEALEGEIAGALAGKAIVLTGGLASLSREEATRLAEEAGARVSSSVSKKTSFVVAGANRGSKHDKAVALGVEIIDEAEFLERLGRT